MILVKMYRTFIINICDNVIKSREHIITIILYYSFSIIHIFICNLCVVRCRMSEITSLTLGSKLSISKAMQKRIDKINAVFNEVGIEVAFIEEGYNSKNFEVITFGSVIATQMRELFTYWRDLLFVQIRSPRPIMLDKVPGYAISLHLEVRD